MIEVTSQVDLVLAAVIGAHQEESYKDDTKQSTDVWEYLIQFLKTTAVYNRIWWFVERKSSVSATQIGHNTLKSNIRNHSTSLNLLAWNRENTLVSIDFIVLNK